MNKSILCIVLLLPAGAGMFAANAIGDACPAVTEVIIGKDVSDSTRAVLAGIATAAGEKQIEISSVNRTPAEQIQIALDAYGSAEKAQAEYGAPCRDAFNGRTKAEMVRKLEEILEALPRPNCMRHVGGAGKIVDVKPSSVSNNKAFYEAVMAAPEINTDRFYYPDISGVPASKVKDAAFHIELK